ncbi:MAG: TatD family hydrolase [Gammaproteobacteria bacterium]
MLVDSHCHLDMLDLESFEGGLDGVLEEGRGMGVGHYLCVSVDLEAYGPMRDLVADRSSVSISVGVHPNHDRGREPDADELVAIARRDGCVAIGETGLDYFRSEGDLEWQRDRFRTHIRAARECGLPLIIHTREARDDTLRILEEEGARDAGGVMHCFAEDWDTAKRAMDIGFYISFSGIVTFKNAVELKEVARQVPADLMLVETDSPYLAPVPKRGKPNQPAFVRHTAEYIAELRGTGYEDLAAQTTANYQRLFGATNLGG